MIFRAIEIECWGCFPTSLVIGPLGEGINVIHGPNETGKSTLAEALARGLFDRHKVSGADADALRPWGREVGPRIAIEFAHGGAEYRLEKRFLLAATSRLLRREGDRFALVAEGDGADERVRAILGATPAGKGLSKSSNWGIAQVLWAPQGKLPLDEPSRDAESRLRDAIGAIASSVEGDRLERRIGEAWAKVFTPKGQLRRGQGASPLVLVEEQRKRLEGDLDRARAELAAFEDASRQLEGLLGRHAALAKQHARATEELAAWRTRSEAYRGLLADKKHHESEMTAARAEATGFEGRIRSLAEARELGKQLEATRASLASRLPSLETHVGSLSKKGNALGKQLAEIRKGLDALTPMREEINDLRRFTAAADNGRALRARLERIDAVEKEIAKLAGDALVAPTREQLSAIRRAAAAKNQARALLDASALTLEITAEAPIDVEADEKRAIAPGESFTVRGAPEVSIRIRGVGRVRARGPVQSGGVSTRERLDGAEEELRALTSPFGTDDVEALEKRTEERERREAAIESARRERRALLDGVEHAALRAEGERLASEAAALRARRPDWKSNPPDLAALEASFDQSERALVPLVRETERERERVLDAASQAKLDRDQERAKLDALPAQIEREVEAERRLVAEDGLDDATRSAKRDDAALRWRASSVKLREVDERFRAFDEDPAREVERVEKEIGRLDDEERRALEEAKRAEGALDARASAGAYSAVARLEEAYARLVEDEARERRRADALQLLHDSVAKARADVVDVLVSPIRTRVEKNLPRISGTGLGALEFGADFRPHAVRPEEGNEAVALDALSGGTAEQLHFVTRLALAEVLSQAGREVIVLDDPLVYTDADRMGRIAAILEEAAERCQVLLFTCHPERYSGLRGAREFDLAALRRAAPSSR